LAQTALFNAREVVASINYHSYGAYVLYPWGYTTDEIYTANEFLRPNTNTKDRAVFPMLAQNIADKIGGQYTILKISAAPGFPAGGTSVDWAYNTKHSASFGVEIGGTFQPPEEDIEGICADNLKGAQWLMFWAVDQAMKEKPKKQ